MPETEALIENWDATATVREFYRSLREKDLAAMSRLISARFADDATVHWPDVLGGTISGADKLGAIFARAISADTGATQLDLVDVFGSGGRCVAEVRFDWIGRHDAEPVRSSALERWTFSDGVVTSIRAYYWDAHQLVAALR